MIIVILTHINSIIALKHLILSLKENKEYLDFNYIIAIGGCYDLKDYEIIENGNFTYVKCNHNSIDFTALIAILELYENKTPTNNLYFHIHDTCKVGKNFFNRVKQIEKIENITSIRINRPFSMNIGVYSCKIINQFKNFLLSKKNTDKNREMEFKSINYNEDYIFHNDKNNIILDNYDGWNYTGPIDYYNTGTLRIIEYYPNMDLYKTKANWGQGTWTLNN